MRLKAALLLALVCLSAVVYVAYVRPVHAAVFTVHILQHTGLYDVVNVTGVNVTFAGYYGGHSHGTEVSEGYYEVTEGSWQYGTLTCEKEGYGNYSNVGWYTSPNTYVIFMQLWDAGDFYWTNEEQFGEWDALTANPMYFEPDAGRVDAYVRYGGDFADGFDGLNVNVTLDSTWACYWHWGDFSVWNRRLVELMLNLTTDDYYIRTVLFFELHSGGFGGSVTGGVEWVSGYVYINSSELGLPWSGTDFITQGYVGVKDAHNGSKIQLVIDPVNSTTLHLVATDDCADFTVPEVLFDIYAAVPSGFNDDPHLSFSAKVWEAEGDTDFLTDWAFGDPYVPLLGTDYAMTITWDDPYADWLGGFAREMGKLLPESVQNYLATISSWLSPLWSIMLTIWGLFLGLLPFAPFLVLFYVLDAGVASVNQGSIQPVGRLSMEVWNFGTAIVGTLTSIAETIWSFIKFW